VSGPPGYRSLRCLVHEVGHVTYAAGISRPEAAFRRNLGLFGKAMAVALEAVLDLPRDWAPAPLRADRAEAAAARELSLYALRLLAGRAHYVAGTATSEADPAEAYREMQDRFALVDGGERPAWRRAEHYAYPSYIPFSFAGALAAYDLLATMSANAVRGSDLGECLRAECYPEGEARPWHDKLLLVTGRWGTSATAAVELLAG
jgi:hypothetical protein